MQPPRGNLFLSFFCLLLFQWDEGGGGGWLVWGRTGFLNSDVDGVVAGLLVLIPLAALVLWLLERTIELTPVAPTPTPPPPPPPLLPSEPCNGALDDVNAEEELEEEALGTRIPDNRRPAITFGTNYLNADGIRGSVYPRSWNNASKHSRFFPKILQENLRSAPRTDDPTERKNRIRKKKHDCRILHAWKFQIKEEEEKQKSLNNIFDLSRDPKNRKEPYNSPAGNPAGNSSDVSPKDSIRVLKNPERVSKIVWEFQWKLHRILESLHRDIPWCHGFSFISCMILKNSETQRRILLRFFEDFLIFWIELRAFEYPRVLGPCFGILLPLWDPSRIPFDSLWWKDCCLGLVDTGELLDSAVGAAPFKGLSGKTTAACEGTCLAAVADSLTSTERVNSKATAPFKLFPTWKKKQIKQTNTWTNGFNSINQSNRNIIQVKALLKS